MVERQALQSQSEKHSGLGREFACVLFGWPKILLCGRPESISRVVSERFRLRAKLQLSLEAEPKSK
jgi:hypothetical protein